MEACLKRMPDMPPFVEAMLHLIKHKRESMFCHASSPQDNIHSYETTLNRFIKNGIAIDLTQETLSNTSINEMVSLVNNHLISSETTFSTASYNRLEYVSEQLTRVQSSERRPADQKSSDGLSVFVVPFMAIFISIFKPLNRLNYHLTEKTITAWVHDRIAPWEENEQVVLSLHFPSIKP